VSGWREWSRTHPTRAKPSTPWSPPPRTSTAVAGTPDLLGGQPVGKPPSPPRAAGIPRTAPRPLDRCGRSPARPTRPRRTTQDPPHRPRRLDIGARPGRQNRKTPPPSRHEKLNPQASGYLRAPEIFHITYDTAPTRNPVRRSMSQNPGSTAAMIAFGYRSGHRHGHAVNANPMATPARVGGA
jgi:hypothetical protein